MARELRVEIVGDARSLERAFGQAGKSSGGFGRALGTASKFAGGALLGLGAAAKIGFAELMEAEKVGAQTAAVLKSTGGAANVSAEQVGKLAGALSHMSGVDDEAIQSGQNLLLTFTNIRNEVGKGNDIFDQATKATLNLSVAMGQDMSSSAILVGKALNDPIKGMGALSRAGIQFTADQKKMIEAMVEGGNAAGAQKLILKELETQFGGSAKAAGETLAGQLNIAKNSLSEMAAELVAALLPALQQLAELGQQAARFMTEHKDAVQIAAIAIAALSVGILAVNVALKAYAAIMVLVRAATIAWTAAQWLLNVALTANPIGVVIVAIAALIAILILAWKESETFRRIVHAALDAVADGARTLASTVQTVFNKFRDLYDWIKRNSAGFAAKLRAPFDALASVLQFIIGLLSEARRGIQWLIDNIGRIPTPRMPDITPGFSPGDIIPGRFGGGGGGGSGSLAMAGGMGMGGRGGEIHLHIENVYGTDERGARELARRVEPYLNRGAASISTR